jgi:hypothetical protein
VTITFCNRTELLPIFIWKFVSELQTSEIPERIMKHSVFRARYESFRSYLVTYKREKHGYTSPSWEAASLQILRNFPAFCGTGKFISVFTRELHWFLPWARSIQSIPSHPISLRSIAVLSTHLRLGLSSGLFHSGFSTNILYAFLFTFPCPSHPWLDNSNYTWRRVHVMKLLIIQFSPIPRHLNSLRS